MRDARPGWLLRDAGAVLREVALMTTSATWVTRSGTVTASFALTIPTAGPGKSVDVETGHAPSPVARPESRVKRELNRAESETRHAASLQSGSGRSGPFA